MSKSIISVFGSTGRQGGSVVRALLKVGNFKVRALTRNPDSDASKSLKELGVDVVKCDDGDSKEVIQEALKNSYGVFSVTFPFGRKENDYDIGKKVADAAFDAGVKHFVFSGLSPSNKISNGRFEVAHFDNKYKVEEHARKLSKQNPSFVSSFVYAPFYFQNFQTFFQPKKSNENGAAAAADEQYTISIPSDPNGKPLEMGDIEDIGPIVSEIFSNQTKYSGSVVPFAGSNLSGPEIANIFSKVTGKKVSFNFIPPSVFRTFGFPGAEEMATMFQYLNEFGAFNGFDKSIAPKITNLTTLEDYLKKSQLKLE
ncbi:hypothetical protein ACTA71_011616 [Dictyostelium dimigraforme]